MLLLVVVMLAVVVEVVVVSSSNSSTCCQLKIIQHQAKVWVEHLSQRDSARERDDIVGRIDGKAMVGRIDEAIKIGQKN